MCVDHDAHDQPGQILVTWQTGIGGFAAGPLISLITAPVGVSGAVFLLPVQLSLPHFPNPAVTPTNLLFKHRRPARSAPALPPHRKPGRPAHPNPARRANPWAAELYNRARNRGLDHPRAVRILAKAWLDIIWKCWTTNTTYDADRHRVLQRLINQDQPMSADTGQLTPTRPRPPGRGTTPHH